MLAAETSDLALSIVLEVTGDQLIDELGVLRSVSGPVTNIHLTRPTEELQRRRIEYIAQSSMWPKHSRRLQNRSQKPIGNRVSTIAEMQYP